MLAVLAAALNLPAQERSEPLAERSAPSFRPLALSQADAGPSGGGGGAEPASEGGPTVEQLAKAVQNPIANLISVPFQNNFNFGYGPNNVVQYTCNFQPVIPIALSKEWHVITRTILPIMNTPSPAPGIRSAFGLGDLNPTAFLSPASSARFIWGVGPSLTFPTATDPLLGNGKFCAGPGLVAVYRPGPWVLGMIGNNQWSYAGWGNKKVNALLMQPLVNYNFKHGWYLNVSPIITANWNASHDNMWTVPIGGGAGKVLRIAKLPVNVRVAAYWNVVTPKDFGADWQLRFEFAFLFPAHR
jgi:hypothetical protein